MRRLLRFSVITALILTLVAGLWIASPPPSEARGSSWSVQVFNNPDLFGVPIWTGVSPSINYTWGAGAPVINGAATGAPADNFSVQFTGSVFFTAGNYRFTAQVDDGVQVLVDGLLLINNWPGSDGLHTVQADYPFAADGNHTITVKMRDTINNASIVFTWALAVGPLPTVTTYYSGVPWYGEFYNNLDLAGAPIFTNSYNPSGLDLQWGQGSPGGVVPVDNFSARFTRSLSVPADIPKGVYTFYILADDNYRFIVDVSTIVDKWDSFAGDLTTVEVTLLDGPHTLKLEYRERLLDARVFLTWTPPNAQNPVLPPPGGAVVPTTQPGQQPQPGATAVPAVTATVKVGTLNVRSAASLSAPVVTRIARGQVFPVTGRSADSQWAQLNVNGQLGWVSAQYVTFSGDFNSVPVVDGGVGSLPAPPPPSGVRGVTTGNLRIRQGPSSRTPTVGVIPWNTEIDVVGIDYTRTWFQVNYAGTVGWSYAPWIRLVQGNDRQLPYTDGTQPPYEPAPATTGVVVQAFGNVRIRSGPGFQYPKIARAIWGTRVQLLGRSSSGLWYKVQYGDVTGWTYARWYRAVQGDVTTVPVTDQ